jgi:anti-sigma B factor antagonist
MGVSAICRNFCWRSDPRRSPSISAGFKPFRYPHDPPGQTPPARDSIAAVSPTPFEVNSEALEGGLLTFTVRGELDLNTAPQLDSPLEQALDAGADRSVLIDLSECEFIDSTGIALIVRAWQRVDRDAGGEGNGRLVLCCSNDQVQRLLKITGVESSISMHGDRDSALAELRG